MPAPGAPAASRDEVRKTGVNSQDRGLQRRGRGNRELAIHLAAARASSGWRFAAVLARGLSMEGRVVSIERAWRQRESESAHG